MRFEEKMLFSKRRTQWYGNEKIVFLTKKLAKYFSFTRKYKGWLAPSFIQTIFVVTSSRP